MKNKLICFCAILGFCLLVSGTVAYFVDVVSGNITATGGQIIVNINGFDDEVTKTLSLGKIGPTDSGSFSLNVDLSGTGSNARYTVQINRINLPNGLKFYFDEEHTRELTTYSSVINKSSTMVDSFTIYWYWDGNGNNENDNLFMDTSISADIVVTASQAVLAYMKNGSEAMEVNYEVAWSYTTSTEFWSEEYRGAIRTITFLNDLSGMPSACNEANLCWDISAENSIIPVYAYLVDTGESSAPPSCFSFDANQIIPELMDARGVSLSTFHDLYIVSQETIVAPDDCSYIFSDMENFDGIEFNGNFITSNVINMNCMFYGNGELYGLDLSSFDTSNVIDMSYMFSYCYNLYTLNVSGFNTNNATNMYHMFYNCESLNTWDEEESNYLDIGHFDFSKTSVADGESYEIESYLFGGGVAT